MSQPFFVDHNGVPLEWQRQPAVGEVEKEPSLAEIAQREAARQTQEPPTQISITSGQRTDPITVERIANQ